MRSARYLARLDKIEKKTGAKFRPAVVFVSRPGADEKLRQAERDGSTHVYRVRFTTGRTEARHA